MRDPKRIDVFCKELAEQWKRLDQWRFGQFIYNIMGSVQSKHGDIFFPEDGKMIEYIKEAVNNHFNSQNEQNEGRN